MLYRVSLYVCMHIHDSICAFGLWSYRCLWPLVLQSCVSLYTVHSCAVLYRSRLPLECMVCMYVCMHILAVPSVPSVFGLWMCLVFGQSCHCMRSDRSVPCVCMCACTYYISSSAFWSERYARCCVVPIVAVEKPIYCLPNPNPNPNHNHNHNPNHNPNHNHNPNPNSAL